MSKKGRILLYGAILVLGLLAFVLEIFVFQKPDGFWGLMICIISLLMIFVGIIKLCQASEKFKSEFWEALDIFSFLP